MAKRGINSAKNDRPSSTADRLELAIAWLRRNASKRTRDGMARFAIPSEHAFGVAMSLLRPYAKTLGRSQELAEALWESGHYEARLLAAFVAEPQRLGPSQMDRWARDFDNWAVCDTVSFHLFDRTAHAWRRLAPWAARREEFVKRAAFATLWGLSVHDKQSQDAPFHEALALVEPAATDERNFVKKGVNMALRAVGKRSSSLHAAAVEIAARLAASKNAAARWVGKDAIRELKSQAVLQRLAKKAKT